MSEIPRKWKCGCALGDRVIIPDQEDCPNYMRAEIKRLESENKELISDRDYRLVAENARLRSELEKAVELLRMLLEAKDCLHNGQPEIVKELSVILDIGLHEANELVTFLQSQKGESHA
jgi:hypothetical protein